MLKIKDIILIALILRLLLLNSIGVPIFDESFYLNSARNLLSNPEHPPLGKFILAGFIALADTPLAWRLPSVIFGLLSIAALFYLAKELFGERIASAAALLLAFDPLHVLLSRVAMLDMIAFGLALAGAYFLIKQKPYIGGALCGLAIATKLPAAAVLCAVLIYRPQKALHALCIAALVFLLFLPWMDFNQMIFKALTVSAKSPQASGPLEWIICRKPVWFAWTDLGSSFLAIIALGNPVFWIPAFLLLFNRSLRVHKFALVWFLCYFVPFLLMPRTHTFLYYMLFILPAYALCVGEFASRKVLFAILLSSIVLLPLSIGLALPAGYFELLKPLIGTPPQ